MKRFILDLGKFCGLLLLCFFALEIPIQLNYKHQISASADWQCLEDINADILIVGNSRVESGFDPIMIENATGLSCFVLAQTGWQSALLRLKLERYLENNRPPSFLVVQADPLHLTTRKDWYSKSNFLKYLFMDREGLFTTLQGYQGFHWYEFYIPFIRYIGVPGRYIRDALNLPMELDKVKGFKPNKGTFRNDSIPIEGMGMADSEIDFLREFFNQTPSATSIAVFPLMSNYLYPKIDDIPKLSEFCATENVLFLNCNKLIENKPDSIYSNHTHANQYGAQIQTELLISHINALQLP
jgi:hypothetical protein